jgi:O-antigen/teichoic acid export membrane protein
MVQGLVILFAFATSAILARVLGPEGLGVYQLLLAWVMVASVFGLPGMNVVVLKSALKNYDRFYWLALRKSLLFSGIGAILVALVGGGLYLYQGAESNAAVFFLLVACSIPLSGFQNYDSVLVGKREFRASRLLSLLGAILTLLLTGATAWITKQAEPVFGAYLLSRAIVLGVGMLVVQRKLIDCPIDPQMELELLSQGWRQTGLAVFLQIASRFDRILLGALDPVLLGIYYIGTLIPQQVATNSKVLLSVLTARWGAKNAKDNLDSFILHGNKLILIGCLASLFIWFVLPVLIPVFFGDQYYPAIHLGQFYSLSLIMSFWYATYMAYEQFQSNGMFAQSLQVIRQVIFLVLVVTLIGNWQAEGVVAAHLIANFFMYLLAYLTYAKARRRQNA